MPGEFTHYPATVATDGKLIARGPAKTFTVVDRPSDGAAVTWESVARSGTPDQIREFLKGAYLRELDWMLVAHRMTDQDVYRSIIAVLTENRLEIPDLRAYSLQHRDEATMKL